VVGRQLGILRQYTFCSSEFLESWPFQVHCCIFSLKLTESLPDTEIREGVRTITQHGCVLASSFILPEKGGQAVAKVRDILEYKQRKEKEPISFAEHLERARLQQQLPRARGKPADDPVTLRSKRWMI
jgi:hypothetical protein